MIKDRSELPLVMKPEDIAALLDVNICHDLATLPTKADAAAAG